MKIKEIINKIKNIFNKKEFSFKYKIGDIVWAKMPEETIKDKNIKPSHRIRPYLIVGLNKEKESYQALACTSKNNNRLNKVPLNLKNEKITYVNINNYVNLGEERIINFSTTINEKELKEVIKLITIKCEDVTNLNIIKKYSEQIFVEVGDVILINNKRYYVYALENEKYHLLKVKTKKKIKKEADKDKFYQNASYYVDLTDDVLIDLKEPCIIFDKFSNKDIVNIYINRKKYKSLKKLLKKQKEKKIHDESITLFLGDVLKYKDKTLIYMYTDKNLNVHYLINQENLKQHPLNFYEMKNINTPFKKIGKLNYYDTLKLISLIKPLLPFIKDNNTAIKDIQKICRQKEQGK